MWKINCRLLSISPVGRNAVAASISKSTHVTGIMTKMMMMIPAVTTTTLSPPEYNGFSYCRAHTMYCRSMSNTVGSLPTPMPMPASSATAADPSLFDRTIEQKRRLNHTDEESEVCIYDYQICTFLSRSQPICTCRRAFSMSFSI
jgi:hypothetical protein